MNIIDSASIPTTEELKNDYGYRVAQKALTEMLTADLIFKEEFKQITSLNRASFQPYLVELMPRIT